MLNFPWNRKNTKYMLDHHIVAQRAVHNGMMCVSECMQYMCPFGHARVQRLVNSILSTDIKVVLVVTMVLGDVTKHNNFEAAVEFLLLAAPTPIVDENISHNISAMN